jgi:acetyl esterase/lipase
VAVGEHSLAPAITMSGMAEEMYHLVRAVSAQAASAGRSSGVILHGMSSGAHLLALTLDMVEVVGALLISGAYDLDPIRLSPLNDAIGMDHAEARACSPLHIPHRAPKPVTVAFGARERPEIRRQGEDFHAVLAAQGYPARLLPVPDTDHFSVLETLAAADGALCRALVCLVEECAGTKTYSELSRP